MKKKIILSAIFILSVASVWFVEYRYLPWKTEKAVTERPDYKEISFVVENGGKPDGGYTHNVLENIRKSEDLLDNNSPILENGKDMDYVELGPEDFKKGVIEKRTFGSDVYEIRYSNKPFDMTNENFTMTKNGEKLFERKMAYGANGPVIDWRIVNGKPAFTLNVVNENFTTGEGAEARTPQTDIYYEGKFIGSQYNVSNPRYLFSYNDKIGFIAQDDGKDRVYFGSAFTSPSFDSINTANCCSYNEILPTLYENGVLLIYGTRDNKYFLAELQLK